MEVVPIGATASHLFRLFQECLIHGLPDKARYCLTSCVRGCLSDSVGETEAGE